MHTFDRRQFLAYSALAVAAVGLAACTPGRGASFIGQNDPAIAQAEARRRGTGQTVTRTLTAQPLTLDLSGKAVQTWGYQGASATEPVRGVAGDLLQVKLRNDLPEATTIHWHGLALRSDMDGVPHLTQQPIAPGATHMYEFTLPHPGTHWFHPHAGTQLDRAQYAPLIVEDPQEEGAYDREWIIVLDDWLDGVTATPDEVLAELTEGMGGMDHGTMGGDGMGGMEHGDSDTGAGGPMRMGNMLMGATSDLLGGDAGDVYYPLFLVNGRPATDPETFRANPGERIRLRILNAGGDTAFRFGITDHMLTVTHTDGYPVAPVEAESIVLGMGERYDAIVTAGEGAFAVIAEALGKGDQALAILRTGQGAAAPAAPVTPSWSRGPVTAADLTAAEEVALKKRPVNRTIALELTGSMMGYDWGINGKRMDMSDPMRDAYGITEGERIALEFTNSTTMWHPMHLHGHTYQHVGGGPRKDTSIVLPGETLRVEFDADNPGRWLTHCHNLYHGEAGMMATLAYQTN
ncbi:multicopper oxidase family protein [Microbacterium lacticum]